MHSKETNISMTDSNLELLIATLGKKTVTIDNKNYSIERIKNDSETILTNIEDPLDSYKVSHEFTKFKHNPISVSADLCTAWATKFD